jgi:hypothetical protein
VEAGSNTSTVTLRVVGGDGKGSLKCETVKYGRKFQGTRTRETLRWQGPAAYIKDTHPLVREGAPQKQDRNSRGAINIWSWAPGGCSIPRLTDRQSQCDLDLVREDKRQTRPLVREGDPIEEDSKFHIKKKSGHGPQKGAQYQDLLTD